MLRETTKQEKEFNHIIDIFIREIISINEIEKRIIILETMSTPILAKNYEIKFLEMKQFQQ